MYALTLDCKNVEVEMLCQEIQNGIKQTKSDEVLCVTGDFNLKFERDKL